MRPCFFLGLLLITGCTELVYREYGESNYEFGKTYTTETNGKDSILIMSEIYHNGQIRSKIRYNLDTIQNGLSQWWYKNGNKMAESNYLDGQLHGEHTYYFQDGNTFECGFHKKGKLDGIYVQFDENGKKRKIERYRLGKLDGRCSYYNEGGSLDSIVLYKDSTFIKRIQ
jgi:antitoxin component YwqK of YwqJK toxin-antitoxin module